jgi:hypothetical protein
MCCLFKSVGLPWTLNTSIRFDSTVVTLGIKDAISWRLDGYIWFPLTSGHHSNSIYEYTWLKQQSADKHVAPLGNIIMIPSQSVCSFSLMLHA